MYRLLKRRSILAYIVLIIIISLFFILLVSLISFFRMKDIYNNINKIFDERLQTIIFANEIQKNVLNIRYLISLTSNVKSYDDIEKRIFEVDKEYRTMIINVKLVEMDETEQRMFVALKADYKSYLDLWEKIKVDLKLGLVTDEEHKKLFTKEEEQLLIALDEFVKYSKEQANDLKEKSRDIYISNIPILAAVILVSFIFLATISMYLINSIRNSIKEVLSVLSKLTEGDGYYLSIGNSENELEKIKSIFLKTLLKQEDIKQLSTINKELIAINTQLKEHAETIEELAVTKERNRFARDIHDNLGHTMVLVIKLLEVCYESYESDADIVKEKLAQAIAVSKDGLKDLKRSIKGLSSSKVETNDLISSLRSLFSDFGSSGVKIDFSYDSSITNSIPLSNTIYRLCQEALTNALKHGKAKRINIILQLSNDVIKLYVFDDGVGCKEIIKGNGLQGMEKRVRELGGSIIYGSDGECGFNINIEIPLYNLRLISAD